MWFYLRYLLQTLQTFYLVELKSRWVQCFGCRCSVRFFCRVPTKTERKLKLLECILKLISYKCGYGQFGTGRRRFLSSCWMRSSHCSLHFQIGSCISRIMIAIWLNSPQNSIITIFKYVLFNKRQSRLTSLALLSQIQGRMLLRLFYYLQ